MTDRHHARRPKGWVAPGPKPTQSESDVLLEPGIELAYLSGDFRIFQRKEGNKWSLDELVTAWVASQRGPAPRSVLDLGTGTASVLMLLLWKFEQAQGVGIEAQHESASLARRSILFNGLSERVSILESDFRSQSLGPRFDLITGTPPYFSIGSGLESEKIQCAPARFEHRGGVEAYVEAAERHLAPGGSFVMVAGALQDERIRTFENALKLTSVLSVRPKPGRPVRMRVYTFVHTTETLPVPLENDLVVRENDNQWTVEFSKIRQAFGFPPRVQLGGMDSSS